MTSWLHRLAARPAPTIFIASTTDDLVLLWGNNHIIGVTFGNALRRVK